MPRAWRTCAPTTSTSSGWRTARSPLSTADGSATTINGTSDWVYEEELGVRDGFRWSPDGGRIAYWQFDSTGVGVFSLVNNTDTLYPSITRIPYPKAGTTNSAVRIGVVSAEGGPTRWMHTPGDPRDSYLARLEWIDASTLAIQQLNRLQNRNDFLQADARTGEVRGLFTDESKAWVDVADVRWIDGGKAFLWPSERDGWRHLYRVPRDGGPATLVTRFEGDVVDVVGVDEREGQAYFLASPDNATQAYLYRARLDGAGTPQRVTPAGQPGTHGYTLAPGARLAFHTYSRFDQAGSLEVVALPDHRSLRALTDTSALAAKLAPVLTPAVEFLKVDVGGGVSLDGWMLKPSAFDAARRYPVVVFVYGEPFGATVNDRWGGGRMLFHRALAEAGYLVVSFDNQGTPVPKGAKWRQDRLRRRGRPLLQATGSRCSGAGGRTPLRRHRSSRRVGLERRRVQHAQLHVSLPGRVQRRRRRGPRARPAPLRHDLSGALHGPAAIQPRRLSPRLSDQFRRGPAGPSPDRSRFRRRQRALPGHRAARQSTDCARQGLRYDGLPQSFTRHLRRAKARRLTSTN